jgi:sRNA-binding regulator protein Hfq
MENSVRQQRGRGDETNGAMSNSKSKAPEQTFEEVKYLRYLIENEVPVCIRLSSNEEVRGTIEFYDANFIRVTRQQAPNLFLFKHDIKYLYEEPAA